MSQCYRPKDHGKANYVVLMPHTDQEPKIHGDTASNKVFAVCKVGQK